MGFLDKYTKQEVANFVATSKNFAEVIIKMGLSANSGSNRMVISQYVKDNAISISHFEVDNKCLSPKDIFVENSTTAQSTMRRYYKRGNYSEYKCAICGQEPFWNGKDLVLTLDHINGVSNDHRLANLRWICPNCYRQLPTYGSKITKKKRVCVNCGATMLHKNKSGLCKKCYLEKNQMERAQKTCFEDSDSKSVKVKTCPICGKLISNQSNTCLECYHKNSRAVKRPAKLEFAKMVKELGFEAVGAIFGLSGKSVQKWCKSYGIPHTKKELIAWYDEQMGIKPEPAPIKKTISEIVRPVVQIDINTMEAIATFASQAEAKKSLGINNDGNLISQVCRGLRKSAYGYFWQYG